MNQRDEHFDRQMKQWRKQSERTWKWLTPVLIGGTILVFIYLALQPTGN